MSVIGSGVRAAGMACLLMLAHLLGAAPSVADVEERLLLSNDGKQFTGVLQNPVFEEANFLVPGASVSQSIWVRNGSSAAATLSVHALTGQGHSHLLQHLSLHLRSEEVDSGWISLGDPDGMVPLLSGLQLTPGEQVRLDIVLRLDYQASNETRDQQASFDFRFFLKSDQAEDTSHTAGVGPEPVRWSGVSAGEQGKGSLASTGMGNAGPLATVGVAALTTGFVIAALARKRRDTGDG